MAEQTDSDILKAIGEQLTAELRAKTPSRSGATREQITYESTDISMLLWGPSYIGVFETGRGPTRSAGGGGGKSLRERIYEWIQIVGITPQERNGKTPTQLQLSYMIAASIHSKGNKLYQELAGGKTDYFDSIFTEDRIAAFLGAFGTRYTNVVFSEIMDSYKRNR